ncbi:MAG: polysaccharide deacetylase family protein [Fimbriimonadaceae bacterium]|nr:polysaccharide deacetylase family protein [Fimbriimonadaceae bacterium]QYK55117.1 MAG: polysaccharide deacetylase family protein [Fimbriimonadaceae bacterium]
MAKWTLARNALSVFGAVLVVSIAVLALTPLGSRLKSSPPRLDFAVLPRPAPPEADPEPSFRELNVEAATSRVIVLMYHDVVPRRNRDTVWFDETSDGMRETLRFIRDNGGTVISMDDLYAHLTQGTPVPERSVVITFDDNYQGVADNAVPVLQEFDAPFTVFVHTDFVGDTSKGRPKMTWETLKTLRDQAKCTVGGHTASHPENLAMLSTEQQRQELEKSYQAIKDNLGAGPDSMAWANGEFDQTSMDLAREAGYKISFAMVSGMAEDSPSILAVRRYPFNKFKQGWEAREQMYEKGISFGRSPLVVSPVRTEKFRIGRADYIAAIGGEPTTGLADGRQGVKEFVEQLGGVAGINGGFFALAAIASDDNQMIGPCLAPNRGSFTPSVRDASPDRLRDRPLVLWNGKEIAFLPYLPEAMNNEAVLRAFMPDMTDCFLGGAWIVKDGVAQSRSEIFAHGPKDAADYRRRVCFGVNGAGEPVCLAADDSVSSADLAQAAVKIDVKWAVLLDSGFSTSLVVDGEILASGHSNRQHPSRPVPHAIVLKGVLASASTQETEAASTRRD